MFTRKETFEDLCSSICLDSSNSLVHLAHPSENWHILFTHWEASTMYFFLQNLKKGQLSHRNIFSCSQERKFLNAFLLPFVSRDQILCYIWDALVLENWHSFLSIWYRSLIWRQNFSILTTI